LVREAFIDNDNIENNIIVHHINGIKYDNRKENLKWVTYSYNNMHKEKSKRYSVCKNIVQLSLDKKEIKLWKDFKEIAKTLGYNIRGLRANIHSKYSYNGFYWEYYDPDLEGEIWKEIKISNISIKVSSLGRVFLEKGKRKTFGSKKIYMSVQINNMQFQVHRLVCRAFHGLNLSDKTLVVNHKDFNKHNNNYLNLEVYTEKQNMQHAGKKISEISSSKIKIKRIDKDENEKIYESIKDAVNDINGCRNYISNICRHKKYHKTYKGYRFEYYNGP